MKIPFLEKFLQKKTPTEYFLALLLRDEKIHAVIFEKIDGRIQVIGEGKANLPQSIQSATDEMLLETADKAISLAETVLPQSMDMYKTVFGVKETWVEDAHITKDYLLRLKTISDQLALKPIGFLVFPEAIAHLLQKEEGAPVSAILIEAGEKHVTITLLRAGRIIATKEVQPEESLVITIEHAISQFENIEILPSRIILFDSQDGKIEKELLTHKWNKSLPFLHVPQITSLPPDFDTRAILFGTATQMGLDAIDLVKQPVKKHEDFFEEQPIPEEKMPVLKSSETTDAIPITNNEDPQSIHTQPHEQRGEEKNEDTSESFGFIKDADIAASVEHPHLSAFPNDEIANEVTQVLPEGEQEEELAEETPGFTLSGPAFVEGAKRIWNELKQKLPKTSSESHTERKTMKMNLPFLPENKLLLLIPLLVLVILVTLLWYIFGVKATVTLALIPKKISQDETITFTTNGSSDPSNNIVAATTVSVNEEGKVSGTATGNKETGNKAKGSVTVFNSDDQSHTLSAGTTITSSNGLNFTLDNDVTVASGSSDPTNLTAGTADVNITASDIGTNYNLPSDTKFAIAGTAVLAAKNDNALSGGTEQSITVVSQKDLDNLTTQLTNNLQNKAKADLSSQIGNDEVLLPQFTKTTAGVTNFDKKVGDQASAVNLDGTVTFQTIAYKKSDIASYTKDAISGQLPSGETLSQNGIIYNVKNMTTTDGTTKATLTITAGLIPTVDTTSLKGQIAGKSFIQAEDILSGLPQYANTNIQLSPNLFFLPQNLPKLSGNITIHVISND